MQPLKKLLSSFHKDYPEKSIATFFAIDTTSSIAKPTTRPTKPLK